MERLTERACGGTDISDSLYEEVKSHNISRAEANAKILVKLAEYEDLEEQGRLFKLPLADDKSGHRECVHTKANCHHEECKCSECPLTELLCDEFYKAIDRCYEDAYASGCLAGIELEKSLKELRGGEDAKV